jgi:protein-tyrosine kinase
VSKIYDALRKAEKDRTHAKTRERKVPVPGTPRAGGERVLLRGMDENFRRSLLNLKNAIDSAMKDKESRVIMFTSAVRGEGKTTMVASLARILALGESDKILVVDCSVRSPELHRLFGVGNDRGILEYLAGTAQLGDIVQPVDRGILDLVTAGTSGNIDLIQPLFNSDRFGALLREAATKYDYVLVDSSAILEAPETPIIGARVDGIVMVVHAAKTRREVIKRAMLMVEKLDGTFIGTVLNRKKYYIPEFIYRRV